jgi:hypothetical protein
MIIGGRKALQNVPVICVGSRRKQSTTLTGTAWVTVHAFTGYENLQEILAIVPSLVGAGVYFGLFDEDYLTDGQERWKSGLVGENTTTDIGLDMICTPGNLLRVKSAGAGTEGIVTVLYGAGI